MVWVLLKLLYHIDMREKTGTGLTDRRIPDRGMQFGFDKKGFDKKRCI